MKTLFANMIGRCVMTDRKVDSKSCPKFLQTYARASDALRLMPAWQWTKTVPVPGSRRNRCIASSNAGYQSRMETSGLSIAYKHT